MTIRSACRPTGIPVNEGLSLPGLAMLPLAGYGFVLGWSVAWPPGPINAEMVRRGLISGFWPALSLGLGACSGDAIWALAVTLGAGALLDLTGARLVLGGVSTALLLLLAALFLRDAWRGLALRRSGEAASLRGRFDGGGAGYALGLGMALTSPWNIAFWLAVIGRPEAAHAGFAAPLLVASSVILGAASWCLALCAAVVLLGFRFASPGWEIATKGATGLLMLFFAARRIWHLGMG